MGRGFFDRHPAEVARDLLGRCLFSAVGPEPVVVRLTEVEAYAGEVDPASHAFRGPTVRNEVMFGEGGHLYRYFIYGMYWCANVVTGPAGTAGGVLLRAGEVVAGHELARLRRPSARKESDLAAGPAKLTAALGWNAVDSGPRSGEDLCSTTGPARLLAGTPVAPEQVVAGPRVGVAAAKEVPWRFWVDGDPTVSTYRRHVPKKTPGRGVD
ncbi:DNA-3-methyladenine glycosylase [Nakamurella silvestris]|nr:DNA-3-methyladenine glycosylase [Nakamurella silvestris]